MLGVRALEPHTPRGVLPQQRSPVRVHSKPSPPPAAGMCVCVCVCVCLCLCLCLCVRVCVGLSVHLPLFLSLPPSLPLTASVRPSFHLSLSLSHLAIGAFSTHKTHLSLSHTCPPAPGSGHPSPARYTDGMLLMASVMRPASNGRTDAISTSAVPPAAPSADRDTSVPEAPPPAPVVALLCVRTCFFIFLHTRCAYMHVRACMPACLPACACVSVSCPLSVLSLSQYTQQHI